MINAWKNLLQVQALQRLIAMCFRYFTKPDPTILAYFYMGSDLANNCYGINLLDAYPSVINIFEHLYTVPPTLRVVRWSRNS